MPVVNSSYVIDGSDVVETHLLSSGQTYVARYLDQPGIDHDAAMAARVGRINRRLTEGEFQQILRNEPKSLALTEQTAAQFANRFWREVMDVFDRGDRLAYAFLLWWLYEMVVGGWITNGQAMASFNAAFGKTLDATQWSALVASRITPAHDRYQGLIRDSEIW